MEAEVGASLPLFYFAFPLSNLPFSNEEKESENSGKKDVKSEVGRPPHRVKLEGLIPGVRHCT